MRSIDNVIITCAITGAIHTPTMSPHLPVTPDEIVSEAVAAADAGASIIHLHVRDPETGEPVTDLDLFKSVASRIQDKSNAIVQPTTGGAPTMTVEDRISVVPELKPEMASCNMGSINFGLYQIVEKFDTFEYEWEREYLENTKDLIFPNSFKDLETVLSTFDRHNTKPELECYDVGHLYNAKHMLDRGLLEPPLHIQFVLGIHGGIGADPENLLHMIQISEKLFGDKYSFSVIGAGKDEFTRAIQAIDHGGHGRFGLEDNLFIRPGDLAKSNVDLIDKATDLVHDLTGRGIATPAETREFLDLKSPEETDF